MWYRFIREYCPVCGRENEWKERVTNEPKPDDYMKRHVERECYDYCEEFTT